MESIENIKEVGLKMTPQRIAVYQAMIDLRHTQLDTIVAYLNERHTTMTLSTVYRVLESFCKAGLIGLVCHPETGECYYDITAREHHHVFDGDVIEDYNDLELTEIVKTYIAKKRPDLKDIEKVQVQITINKCST